MKTQLKKRIATFLCVALSIPMISGAFPQTAIQASAASNVVVDDLYFDGIYDPEAKRPTVILSLNEKGFYASDYTSFIGTSNGEYVSGTLAVYPIAKFGSRDTSVAVIDKKTGLITPKKEGSTWISITAANRSLVFELKVVKSVDTPAKYKQINEQYNKFLKAYGTEITTKNRYAVVNAFNNFDECVSYFQNAAYYDESVNLITGLKSDYDETGITVVQYPSIGRLTYYNHVVKTAIKDICPIGTAPSKMFVAKKTTGTGRDITVTLNRRVNDDDIFSIKAATTTFGSTNIKPGEKASFPVLVYNMSNFSALSATATVVKGSKTMTIKLNSGKLKSGTKYMLAQRKFPRDIFRGSIIQEEWLRVGANKFTAK